MRLNLYKKSIGILKRSFKYFNYCNGLKLSAALSYYTIFSIGPLLIIIISLAGIFLGKSAVEGRVYAQLKDLVGSDAALQVQNIISNIRVSNHGKLGGVIGFIVLLIGASGVFSEIQGSINYIWSIPPPRKKGFLVALFQKLLSFSLLVGLAFLMIVSLLVNALIELLSNRLEHIFSAKVIKDFYAVNLLIIFLIITFLFTIIFKILPNARIRWKDAIIGACVTAVLFLIGKFIIGFYLGNSKIGVTYGATASIVILMLWVYYSSIILYFGAVFTRMRAEAFGNQILPR
jgi:membrane protein